MSRFSNVVKRSGAVVPFNKERIANAIYRAAVEVGGRDKELAAQLSEKVVEQLEKQCAPDCVPHIEDIQDVVEKVLIESGHAKVAKAYIIYREDAARRRTAATQRASKPSEFLPWAKIWHTLDWAAEHKLNTIENLNARILAGEFTHIVHESEIAYEDQINRAVEMIKEKSSTLKMVLITGPSSSGKTTTTIKLDQKLNKLGYSFVTLNIDNYFFDLALHPKDEFGDYDFETPFALDLELINDHLFRLTKGEKVKIPFYDFKTGTRHLNQTEIKLNKNEILLIDSLHGLFPDMTNAVSDEMKFKLYLEPLMQMKDSEGNYIRWADIRLIRRMLRDSVHRAYNPEQTLLHWHYVRASELRNIIPYINSTDYIINSAMPYEIALYSPKLLARFVEWEEKFKDDVLREDAYMRAARVLKFLSFVEPVEDDSAIPGDSVLREFIGGSVNKY